MTPRNIKRFFYTVLIGVGIILLAGGRGIIDIHAIYRENKRIEKNISTLQKANQTLFEEIYLLRNDRNYQEKVVRQILDFSQEGEIIYEFSD